MNITSILCSSSLLDSMRPMEAPTTAQAIIMTSSSGSNDGTSPITRFEIRLTVWEKKMMYSELRAQVFVSMLKK